MSTGRNVVSILTFLMATTAFAGPKGGRAATAPAEPLLPVEQRIRERFPTVALESHATLEPAQQFVAGQMVSGMRARMPRGNPLVQPASQIQGMPNSGDADSGVGLRVFYPASYNEPFVVESGHQRVALRPLGAHFAQATASSGKVFYANPHDSVDVIELPSTGRSEELLLLRDERAPRTFEYEIVEMRGVTGLIMQDGAIRFTSELTVPTLTQIAGGRFIDLQPSLQIDRPWIIDANGRRSDSAARWTIVEEKDQPRRIRLTISAGLLAFPIVVDPSFSQTGLMSTVRSNHTATLLSDGRVLMAGGVGQYTAELYDPTTGVFKATTGAMSTTRTGHTATLLPNGKVLIAGGNAGNALSSLDTAELFEPGTGLFTPTATMKAARQNATATLLPNGKVLLAGGAGVTSIASAELFDPSAGTNGTFTLTAPMSGARAGHTATLLPNGKVLVAGGSASLSSLSSAELFDPAGLPNGTFSSTANMNVARQGHTATFLPSVNKVLVTGGGTAELFDPAGIPNGTFTNIGSPPSAQGNHTATLLPNGKVLLAGGKASSVLTTATLYDPGTLGFTTVSPMNFARYYHTATLLPSGNVLIAGGYNDTAYLNTAEIYDYPQSAINDTGTMHSLRDALTATSLPNGKVLIAGGYDGSGYPAVAEVYDPVMGIFIQTGSMKTPRNFHTATLLANGKVMIAGGFSSNGVLAGAVASAELYDPATEIFNFTGSLAMVRYHHTTTLLPNGKVLIAGGQDDNSPIATAELYDPSTGMFSATGSLAKARQFHTATLLANGKVLIAGGRDSSGPVATAELYDPATGTFIPTGSLKIVRYKHTATLLGNGTVLIAGGLDSSSVALNRGELYDPSGGGTFVLLTAPLLYADQVYAHTATLLPNGKVLIAGGYKNSSSVQLIELYDPLMGTFNLDGNLSTARYEHTSTLLSNGKVLFAGGLGGSGRSSPLSSAEFYDVGLGYSDARRPVVSPVTSPLCQPGNLALSGALFTGESEGSGGSTNSSVGNAPLLRLLRVDNEQSQFALVQSFSGPSYVSAMLSNLSSGRYRATIVSNAIPSIEQIIEVETVPLLATYGTASANLSGSTVVSPSSLPSGYNGAFYPQSAAGSSGFTGTLTVNGTSGAVTVTNAGPTGDYTITVSSSTSCGSPTTTFLLKVIGLPFSVTATGGTPQSAQVNTAFGSPLQATVTDSAGHPLNNVGVTFTVPSSGASATLPGNGSAQTNSSGVASIIATANGTLGSYNVTATVGTLMKPNFALTNTPVTPTNTVATATTPTSVSITWNGTTGATYEVLRLAAGGITSTVGTSSSGSLTDNTASAATAYLYKVRAISPSLTPYGTADLATTVIFTDPVLVVGSTTAKAVHITELRTAVEAVRTLAGLGAGTYTTATLTPGVTVIRAVDVVDLRTALNAARNALPLLAISYTRPAIVSGMTIAAADINDLRNGV